MTSRRGSPSRSPAPTGAPGGRPGVEAYGIVAERPRALTDIRTFDEAMSFIRDRSGYDRGFISNPFAGDEAARLGLIRTREILAKLGNPQRAFHIVHVAGSKGKGSTCSFIDSILRAGGTRTGRFLSPHMHSFRERFVVDDVVIPEADFTGLVAEAHQATLAVERDHPDIGQLTAWELSTAIALLWFARSECEVAVVEVGLGGTLDATNVVHPAVSVISTLDFEHTAILGTTMTEIAGNKAGIIKPGVPVVSAVQPPEGLAVIEARAKACDAPLQIAERDWQATGSSTAFTVEGPTWRHDNLRSSLYGDHQVANAGLAIAAVHALSGTHPIDLSDSIVRYGIANTFIPGRFEIVRHASGATLVLDGAHTPQSMVVLASAIRDRFPGSGLIVVAGMLSDKDPDLVLPPLETEASLWIATDLHSPRALPAVNIVTSLASRGIVATRASSMVEALETALAHANSGEQGTVILVTGSLTTVGEARHVLGLD